MNKYEGRSSFGSDEYFDKTDPRWDLVLKTLWSHLQLIAFSANKARSNHATPMLSTDMTQLKEGVRNVAGKLSNIATDVYNAIPVSNQLKVLEFIFRQSFYDRLRANQGSCYPASLNLIRFIAQIS